MSNIGASYFLLRDAYANYFTVLGKYCYEKTKRRH